MRILVYNVHVYTVVVMLQLLKTLIKLINNLWLAIRLIVNISKAR